MNSDNNKFKLNARVPVRDEPQVSNNNVTRLQYLNYPVQYV